MAVMQMNRLELFAKKNDRKKILEFLQRQGNVEIRDFDKPDDIFQKISTASNRALLKNNEETAKEALKVLKHRCPEPSSFTDFLKGRTEITVAEHNAFYQRKDEALSAAQRILDLERLLVETEAELIKIDTKIDSLAMWMNLPFSQTLRQTKKTSVFIGYVEGEYTLADLLEKIAAAAPLLDGIHLEIVSSSKEQTCFYMIVLKEHMRIAEDALSSLGFTYPSNPSNEIPYIEKEKLLKKKDDAQAVISQTKQEFEDLAPLRDDIRFLQDYTYVRSEKYSAIEQIAHTKYVFVLHGYVTGEDSSCLEHNLTNQFDCVVNIESADADDNAPVRLKNRRFFRPIEPVLESYSLPGKGELDPSSVLSVFYYIMFGLMFSDAGYGLIMASVCAACLLIFKNMEDNLKKNISLFFWCGVSTIFWGIIFSSHFGDVLNVVSRTFFGHEIGIPPVWFLPLEQPMKLLTFCLGIGVVHLTAAYVMKALTNIKNGKYIDVLYDAFFPVAILYSLLLVLMNSEMFADIAGFKLSLSERAIEICLIVSAACMVGVVLTGGRESKNWIKRLLKGVYELYNVLAGWLGDILSYSRLLALGLATGVIASVVNSLGTMAGGGVIGAIVFIVVFVIGHSMNFGINALGAYVHSNRLEYVEFFGKFYEGGGRKFSPFGIYTEHYKFKEEV